MILSHRVALMLLNRKNQDFLARLGGSGQLEVPGGKVSRKLERFAALAARLARLGSRDLPLPGRLNRLDLPVVPQVADEAAVWTGAGLAAGGGVQEPVLAGLRPAQRSMAATQAPSRAVLVAASETRTRAGHAAVLAGSQEGPRLRKASPAVRVAVPQTRDTALPAPQQRSAVAAIQAVTAAAGRSGGGRAASVQQGPASRVLSVVLPLHKAKAADGRKEAVPSEGARRVPDRHAVSAGRFGSSGAAALEIMQMAQVKATQSAAVPGSAVAPSAVAGLALSPAAGAVPAGTPAPGSTSGVQQRLAVLRRSVVSLPRSGQSQDILRRQVVPPASMPNRPAGVPADGTMQNKSGNQQTAYSSASGEGGFGADAGRMVMVSLAGDVVIDGRRLGQVAASSQASRASLPAHGPSRVNLRAVPIHPGMQIPQ